jgi:hypothetical protein
MARAILAVIVGYAVWTVVWLGGNAIFFGSISAQVAEGEPLTAAGPLLGVIALSVACSVAAGLSAAALAKERASAVVLVTAVLLLLTGIAVQSGMWRLMPLWYHATFLVLIVPVCVMAGRLRRQVPIGKPS